MCTVQLTPMLVHAHPLTGSYYHPHKLELHQEIASDRYIATCPRGHTQYEGVSVVEVCTEPVRPAHVTAGGWWPSTHTKLDYIAGTSTDQDQCEAILCKTRDHLLTPVQCYRTHFNIRS